MAATAGVVGVAETTGCVEADGNREVAAHVALAVHAGPVVKVEPVVVHAESAEVGRRVLQQVERRYEVATAVEAQVE